MPDNLVAEPSTAPNLDDDHDSLRVLNRSPHPYHHQSAELPHPSERFVLYQETTAHRNGGALLSPTRFPALSNESSPASESGTEADDEHFLKGLPAPKAKLHKGLRGRNEVVSGASTPIPSPAILEKDETKALSRALAKEERAKRRALDLRRRNKVWVRRATEAGIVVTLGCMVASNPLVAPLVHVWCQDLELFGLLCGTLLAAYPVRAVAWAYRHRHPSQWIPFQIPLDFDPAPILYPPTITLLVFLLVSVNKPVAILPGMILAISSIPQALIPKLDYTASFDCLHWALSCLPLAWGPSKVNTMLAITDPLISVESLLLVYPLHQTLCIVLHHLTTTSLLTAELQLFSVALISTLLLAHSPQMQILKALLWVGGLGTLVSCGPVIRWGIALARVPRWRFRSGTSLPHQLWRDIRATLCWPAMKKGFWTLYNGEAGEGASDGNDSSDDGGSPAFERPRRHHTFGPNAEAGRAADGIDASSRNDHDAAFGALARRHTLSQLDRLERRNSMHTPSGRRKRATSISVLPYLQLTYEQAAIRKWIYALYVYVSMLAVILLAVRWHIQRYALSGEEPIGWGIGYAFGGIPWFRFQVVKANLERWICLPERWPADAAKQCGNGWVQHIRHDDFGEANTRLILTAYWLMIIVVGLVIVFRLKETYEVDTRRKVFHFMMVGMFLPATFVDPTYAALALALALAIFLILDLLRASQLPPLSKPIASFLAPYVDGRDFRGPVVISHIFLLIGCAIPLWLALAALPRTGSGYLAGWEIPTRDVGMVSGVVCVGLGDAAASLIGRRYGHRKWFWGGGKSLEGSAAFALAVFTGLEAATLWLRLGGWPEVTIASHHDTPVGALVGARNAAVCASMASLTEAVLTGGNDNVIVPVVLWTCVKSLGV
ncbi:dolichol kinase [Purpureocillium takamizusanense]|uniref:dolichol kinase n=1 Tax=Purpureocillium takamizusanense TaxID=2060973 RepID=A0A9Q8QGB3_9HYPO|nr:dolichol kinase [Purpureocillium takamizusanense]UNI18732.1 dolichol kinase [Purpureocillium takamizusanense]